MLRIKQFAFNDFGENTYLVIDTDSRQAIVADPGMSNAHERKLFDDYLKDNNLTLTQIINTHLHIDHCIGANWVRRRYGVKIAANEGDAILGNSIGAQARSFGLRQPEDISPVAVDVPLREGDTINLGKYELKVIEVPGHSSGGIVIYCSEGGFALVGDSIFKGSIGRTDLPGGDHRTLVSNLQKKILTLPDDTKLLPGHGPVTTVGYEKAANPYI